MSKKNTKAVFVTKPFIPPFEEYTRRIKPLFEEGILTNNGKLVQEFEELIKNYLNVPHFQFITNGTLALQLAISSLGIQKGEIITSPFSYVASVSSILWQNCTPVFVDIEPHNFTIDPQKIEKAITKNTKAILPVHVFGYACDIEAIENIAKKHKLPVIYDGAHAFGATFKGKSLLNYGDLTITSFHATKLFHTAEGGACIIQDPEIAYKYDLQKRYGHNNDEHLCLGINAKPTELQAAMGLTNFPYIEAIIERRKTLSKLYDSLLCEALQRPRQQEGLNYNYAYYPLVFPTEKARENAFAKLAKAEIFPRRYFFPSLNTLPYLKETSPCPLSEDIANRIACLPLYADLHEEKAELIAQIVMESL